MAVVNEIITEFGFDGSITPLTDYNDALGKSIGMLAAMAAGIVATGAAVAAFTTSTTAALDPVIQLSRTTGVAVEAIQELGFAASVTGSDAATLESTIGSLTDKIGEAAQRGSEDFARLGISVRDLNGDVKTADRVLLEVGQRFRDLNLSLSERRSMAAALGIDASLIQLLGQTGTALDETRAKARALGVVTTEQADAAASLNDSMTTLRFAFSGIQNQLAVGLAPQLEDITSGFVDFLVANREVISDGLGRVLELITATAKAVVRLTPAIAVLTGGFLAWKVASLGVATVMGAIFSPVVLITAGIAALLLVVDDLIVAFNGGQSVIADFFQEFLGVDIVPHLRAAVDATVALFDGAVASISATFDAVTSIFSGFFSLLTGDIDGAVDSFKSAGASILESWSAVFSGVTDALEALFGFDVIGSASQIAADLTSPIRDAFADLFEWITSGFSSVADAAGAVADFFGFGDDQEQEASVVVRRAPEIVPENADFVPEGTTADGQELDRAVTVRDLFDIMPGEPPAPELSPVRMLRDVSVLDALTVNQTAPELSPLEDVDLQANRAAFAGRVTPQPIANNSTANSRSVNVEQNNSFTITGRDGREIADSVTDRLQDQLDDARTQFELGSF